jgi:hypothetical protein
MDDDVSTLVQYCAALRAALVNCADRLESVDKAFSQAIGADDRHPLGEVTRARSVLASAPTIYTYAHTRRME